MMPHYSIGLKLRIFENRIATVTPSSGKGAAACEVAGRGYFALYVHETPPYTRPQVGIAQSASWHLNLDIFKQNVSDILF